MRNLFLVGAKLLGTFFFFWAITALSQVISGLIGFRSTLEAQQPGLWLYIAALLFSFLLNLALGIFLVFSTNKIADILKIHDTGPDTTITFRQYVRIGIVLIGVFTLSVAVPDIIGSFARMKLGGTLPFSFSSDKNLISSILKSAVGFWFAFGSGQVVNLITKHEIKKTAPSLYGCVKRLRASQQYVISRKILWII